MNGNPRDYGYGDSPDPKEPPVERGKVEESCPNCGGQTMHMIEAVFDDSPKFGTLQGSGDVVGFYVGCSACPFATPMMSRRK